jgi:hypothetical protein
MPFVDLSRRIKVSKHVAFLRLPHCIVRLKFAAVPFEAIGQPWLPAAHACVVRQEFLASPSPPTKVSICMPSIPISQVFSIPKRRRRAGTYAASLARSQTSCAAQPCGATTCRRARSAPDAPTWSRALRAPCAVYRCACPSPGRLRTSDASLLSVLGSFVKAGVARVRKIVLRWIGEGLNGLSYLDLDGRNPVESWQSAGSWVKSAMGELGRNLELRSAPPNFSAEAPRQGLST